MKENTLKGTTQEKIMELLDTLYSKAIDGIQQVGEPIEAFAAEYTSKYPDKEVAAKKMIQAQVIKCTTSGVITGFGGLITLPVAIPANIGSVLYVQMRMIACAAYMSGFDVHSDQVQTLVYACLAGVSINELVKQAGIQLSEKLAVSIIKKIPREALNKINQKVGFRFVTKFGEKGILNLGKAVPVVGAAVNGGLDYIETRIIGKRAFKAFVKGDYSAFGEPDAEENVEDIINGVYHEIDDEY